METQQSIVDVDEMSSLSSSSSFDDDDDTTSTTSSSSSFSTPLSKHASPKLEGLKDTSTATTKPGIGLAAVVPALIPTRRGGEDDDTTDAASNRTVGTPLYSSSSKPYHYSPSGAGAGGGGSAGINLFQDDDENEEDAPAPPPPPTIDELIELTSTVALSDEDQDALMTIWIAASSADRLQIKNLYPQYLGNRDSAFFQRLHFKLQSMAVANAKQQRLQQQQNLQQAQKTPTSPGRGGKRGSSKKGTSLGRKRPRNEDDEDDDSSEEDEDVDEESTVAASSRRGGAGGGKKKKGATNRAGGRPSSSSLVAKPKRAEEVECRLTGEGPFTVEFGVVVTPEDNEKLIQIYATQFTAPDVKGIREIVRVPKFLRTKTRNPVVGNFSWFLRSKQTTEVMCCVTVTVHRIQGSGKIFIEMPFFATASGYKRLGLARLLSAALQEHCMSVQAHFILVSAEQNAVPFWKSPSMGGYKDAPAEITRAIDHYYQNDCERFESAQLLVWINPHMAGGGGGGAPRQAKSSPASTTTTAAAIKNGSKPSTTATTTTTSKTGSGSGPSSSSFQYLAPGSLVDNALKKMPKFLLDGSYRLPMP